MPDRNPMLDPVQGDKLSAQGFVFVVDIVKDRSVSFVKWREEKPLIQAYGKCTLAYWRKQWLWVTDAVIIERGDE